MKKQYSLHSISSIIVLLLALLKPTTALAYNSCTDDHILSWDNGLEPSIAWNDQFLYTAAAWNPTPEESMDICEHFRLIQTDRQTGKSHVLDRDYARAGTTLMIDDDNLYIFTCQSHVASIIELPQASGQDKTDRLALLTELVMMDFDGNILKTIHVDMEYADDTRIKDQLIVDKKAYLAAQRGIYCLDIETESLELIYQANDEIRNDFYRNHMVLENGVLYLHDGDALVALDLVDMSSKRVCYFFSEPSILTWEAFPCCNYVYIVLENHLYFWDAILHEMVDIDLVTGVKECLTKDRYWFAQVSSQGLFAIRIDELALKRIYNSISYSYLRPEVKREQWSKYAQYLFFEFQNDRDLILDPNSDRVIDLGDENKDWMFLDKKQFILYDFVYGDEVTIYSLQ